MDVWSEWPHVRFANTRRETEQRLAHPAIEDGPRGHCVDPLTFTYHGGPYVPGDRRCPPGGVRQCAQHGLILAG